MSAANVMTRRINLNNVYIILPIARNVKTNLSFCTLYNIQITVYRDSIQCN